MPILQKCRVGDPAETEEGGKMNPVLMSFVKVTLITAGVIIVGPFIFIFLMSFHPKTRRLCDRLFHFKDDEPKQS